MNATSFSVRLVPCCQMSSRTGFDPSYDSGIVSAYGCTLPSTRDTYARTTCPFFFGHDGVPASSSRARQPFIEDRQDIGDECAGRELLAEPEDVLGALAVD